MDDSGGRRWLGWETALGGLLVLLGIVVWLGQALELDLGRVGWPLFVIVPGLALLGVGLAATSRFGEVLATVGGLVTMVGLVLHRLTKRREDLVAVRTQTINRRHRLLVDLVPGGARPNLAAKRLRQ